MIAIFAFELKTVCCGTNEANYHYEWCYNTRKGRCKFCENYFFFWFKTTFDFASYVFMETYNFWTLLKYFQVIKMCK